MLNPCASSLNHKSSEFPDECLPSEPLLFADCEFAGRISPGKVPPELSLSEDYLPISLQNIPPQSFPSLTQCIELLDPLMFWDENLRLYLWITWKWERYVSYCGTGKNLIRVTFYWPTLVYIYSKAIKQIGKIGLYSINSVELRTRNRYINIYTLYYVFFAWSDILFVCLLQFNWLMNVNRKNILKQTSQANFIKTRFMFIYLIKSIYNNFKNKIKHWY